MSRSDRRALASKIFVAIIAVILILGISFSMILSLMPDKVAVPDLLGQSLSDAKTLAGESGLALQVVATVSAEHAPGRVVSQKPAAGMSVSAGTTVEVEVSR